MFETVSAGDSNILLIANLDFVCDLMLGAWNFDAYRAVFNRSRSS
jgi:hypothetical protein